MCKPVSEHDSILASLPEASKHIISRLSDQWQEAGEELMLVGGVVRDVLLGMRNSHEIDFATSAIPERSLELAQRAGATSAYLIGVDFGTIGLLFEGEGDSVTVEITTYRSEQYPENSRKPDVAFGESLHDDLSRRDFTINAIAADARTGEIQDPYHGRADLDAGLIRAVGDPDARFQEDPLRLLRAVRFVSQLGFAIEGLTLDAITKNAINLNRISSERIYTEMTRLLTGDYASHGLQALLDTGLLHVSLPELTRIAEEADRHGAPHIEKDLWEHTKRVVDRSPPIPIVRWAALLHDAAKPQSRRVSPTGEIHFFGHEQQGARLAARLLDRLHAGKAMQSSVSKVIELHGRPESYDRDWTDSAVRRLMLDAGDDIEPLLQLATADVTSAREERQKAAERRVAGLRQRIAILEEQHELAALKSPLDGNELMEMFDRPPGRWIADVKNHLTELVIEGELDPDDKLGAIEIAGEFLNLHPS